MFNLRKHIAIAAILGSMIFTGSAMAHTTVLRKNTPTGWETRDNIEGKSSVNQFSIPHGCNGLPIEAQSVVFPNGVSDVTVRTDTDQVVDIADHIIGNAVMGPKPAQTKDIFKKQSLATGPVAEYNNHGLKTTDVRAFYYMKGKLPNEFLGLLPWRGSFPKFKPESCATALRVNIGIANYCTDSKNEDDNDRADVWIGHLTPKFDDPDVVSVGFWPFLMVVRDLENNPISPSCGDGYKLTVSPSDESIDELLVLKGYWPYEKENESDD